MQFPRPAGDAQAWEQREKKLSACARLCSDIVTNSFNPTELGLGHRTHEGLIGKHATLFVIRVGNCNYAQRQHSCKENQPTIK